MPYSRTQNGWAGGGVYCGVLPRHGRLVVPGSRGGGEAKVGGDLDASSNAVEAFQDFSGIRLSYDGEKHRRCLFRNTPFWFSEPVGIAVEQDASVEGLKPWQDVLEAIDGGG